MLWSIFNAESVTEVQLSAVAAVTPTSRVLWVVVITPQKESLAK